MKRSPLQMSPEMKRLAIEANFVRSLTNAGKQTNEAIAEVKRLLFAANTLYTAAVRASEKINKLPKGEKGDRGPAGLRGLNGKDGADGKDGETPKIDLNAIVSTVLSQINIPQTEEIVQALIKELKEKKLIKKGDIDGLESEFESVRSQATRYAGMEHGSGDTVAAGSNITLTRLSNGKVQISSTGGGATVETPTGTVDASNAVFTPSAEPEYVIADGITYFDGAGYTWNGSTITMDIPPSQYIRAFI